MDVQIYVGAIHEAKERFLGGCILASAGIIPYLSLFVMWGRAGFRYWPYEAE